MSDTQTIQMTQAGYDSLLAEYTQLKEDKLPAAIKRLALARSHGDLSENAEYHAAKEDLAMLEGRISELDHLISLAVVVQPNSGQAGTISMGSQVIVEIDGKGDTHVYHIVGEFEADPMAKKISEKSPLGQALVGKRAGEKVEIEVPAGKVIYVIREVK